VAAAAWPGMWWQGRQLQQGWWRWRRWCGRVLAGKQYACKGRHQQASSMLAGAGQQGRDPGLLVAKGQLVARRWAAVCLQGVRDSSSRWWCWWEVDTWEGGDGGGGAGGKAMHRRHGTEP
jgi:hypothetical protein